MLLFVIFSATIVAVAAFECPGGQLTPQQRKDIVRQNNKFRSLLIRGKLKNRNGTYMPRGKNMLQLVKMY
ncbi:unnamed protein product [Wuchereria bancrofti]|uniref:Uncharacterized protein n=1 Tax=Wuchereria bancrofti TaxID=6293 RepID=A0A3P7FJC9_WUCBA|nr:unnamed protein product [Wuchereria bancrofti]